MMKIRITLTILLLSFTYSIYSQWVSQTSGTTSTINDIQIFTLTDVYAVSNSGQFLTTTNGGNTWATASVPGITGIHTMFFLNSSTGYVGGNQGVMLKTTNGGTSWTNVTHQSGLKNCLFFNNTTTGYVGDSFGNIYKTTNGGTNWTELETDVTTEINQIFFTNLNTGWFVSGNETGGLGNSIKKTTNGGANWVLQQSESSRLISIHMIDASTGFATKTGQILKTTNGGTNWFDTDPGNGIYLDVYMASSSIAYVCGTSGMLKKTTNGGLSWGTLASGTTQTLRSLQSNVLFVTLAYAVGNNGTILKTTNGGGNFVTAIQPVSNEIPNEFTLSQNYPNPFNPQTTISFGIPKQSNVQLKVYDMLGKEVAELVNEDLASGNYSMEFSAAELPSGTYFYRLTAGEFTQTKKLILIK